MKLKNLVFEGNIKEEKQHKEEFMHVKTYHITRILIELLGNIEIDGNRKITISTQDNEKKYLNASYFKASVYYLSSSQKAKLKQCSKNDFEVVVAEIIREVLTDIAVINNCKLEIINQINKSINDMIEMKFKLISKMKYLCKASKENGLKAIVYRVLDGESGETWRIEVVDKSKNIVSTKIIGGQKSHFDRRGLYKSSIWSDHTFVLSDSFNKIVEKIEIDQSI